MSLPCSTAAGQLISAEELAKETHALASLPEVYQRLREVMASEGSSMQDAADVIALDPSFTARVLKLANSAKYNLRSQVDTVSRAAAILGLKELHDLVLVTSVTKIFDGFSNVMMDMMTFWHRSVHRAFIAENLAKATGQTNTESIFTRALLLDIGHLVLYQRAPDACRQALASSNEDFASLLANERMLIGCDALEVGAALMREWRMPESYTAAFDHLLEPKAAAEHAWSVAILHIAMHLTHGLDTDRLLKEIIGRIKQDAWDVTELWPNTVNELVEQAAEDVIEATYKIFVSAA